MRFSLRAKASSKESKKVSIRARPISIGLGHRRVSLRCGYRTAVILELWGDQGVLVWEERKKTNYAVHVLRRRSAE